LNILMVLSTNTFPPDRRVEREARDLIRDGHRVFLMARRAPGQSDRQVYEGVTIIRVPLPFQRRRVLADCAYYLVQRYLMLFYILRTCRRHDIEALHCHDLPYAFATALAAGILNLPFVLDLHEHYTAMLHMGFQSATYRPFRLFSGMLLAVLRCEERFAARRANRVVVVAEEHIPRIVGLGVARERIIEVTNTEDGGYFAGLPIDPELTQRFGDAFVILYIGGFDPERGIDTALEAMPAVLKEIPNAMLVLIGKGVSRAELERQSESLGLGQQVVFLDFQPFSALPSFIQRGEVFLIPHISTPLIEVTMPNKLFQPMILGKAVLVSSTGPMMRVVHDARCGLVFKERDPQSLAEQIIALRDPDLRTRLGKNGRRAVENKYNWAHTVAPLLEVYRNLDLR
jgi:glycosyltransferase involved in cell wall biosynthesis